MPMLADDGVASCDIQIGLLNFPGNVLICDASVHPGFPPNTRRTHLHDLAAVS